MAKQLQSLRTALSLDNEDFHQSSEQSKSDLKALRSEMNFVKASGREYANSMEGLTKQSDILNRQLKSQTHQLEQVKKKYDAAAKASGENSDEAKKLLSQYNNLASQTKRTERKLESINDTIDEQSNKWRTLSKRVDEAGDNIKTAGGKMSDFGQTMTASVTAPILGFGVAAVEMTRDFRTQIAKLETNAEDAGISIKTMNDSMRELSGISNDTEANVEALSNLMATGANADQLEQAIESLSGAVIKFPETIKIEEVANALQETLATGKATGQFGELLERLGVNLDKFNKGLKKAKDNGNELDYALGKLEDFNLSGVTKEFEKTNESLVNARKAEYDFQKSIAELGETLEPIMTRVTEAITGVVEKFNDLDESTQNTILKMAGIAAAVGPASIALGGLTSTVGNISKGVGSLTNLLGGKGKKGLIARFAIMGAKSGPIGLATLAAGGLAFGIYKLIESSNDLIDVSLDSANAMQKRHDKQTKLIDQLADLRRKSNLTNQEFGEYLDLQTKINNTTNPDKIAALKEQMEKLQKKSGLSNKELNQMVGLNKKITETMPKATDKITEQGNRVAGTTDKLRKYNEQLQKATVRELQTQRLKALQNQAKIRERINEKEKEYQAGLKAEKEIRNELLNYSESETQEKIEQIKKDIKQHAGQKAYIASQKIKLDRLRQGKDALRQQLINIIKSNDETKKELHNLKTKQGKLDLINQRLQTIYLKNAGVNDQKAQQLAKDDKALGYVNKQINKLQAKKQKLLEQTPVQQRNNALFREAVDEIDSQIGRLKTARGNIQANTGAARRLTDELGQDVNKNVTFTGDGISEARRLNSVLEFPAHKNVTVDFDYNDTWGLKQAQLFGYSYATGTDHHPGGSFLAGEEGYELGRLGNRWEMLNLGVYDRPAGYQVFPHDESKRILNALNSMPGYADGARPVGEADRVINQAEDEPGAMYEFNFYADVDGAEFVKKTIHITDRELENYRVDKMRG